MLRVLIRRLIDAAEPTLARFFSRSRTLTRIYFGLLSPRFSREQFAVLQGRARFSAGVVKISNPRLRRNVHRLEKGLLMRPRVPVFALNYIGETVEEFHRACVSGVHDAAELAWAADVLREFFEVVQSSPKIDAARCVFEAARGRSSVQGRKNEGDNHPRNKIPHPRSTGIRSSVDYEQFLSLCQQRRSVRWFQAKPVPRDLIERAARAAAEAPSACNRQPFLFRLFEAPEEAASVTELAMGTRGYSQQVPALVVVLGDFSSFALERDRHLPYIDSALAAMQFMLALETLGLGSCPINWPDIEFLERRMERRLELPNHLRPVMLIAIGYPDPEGGVAHSEKKPVSLLLRTSNDYRD